MLHDLGKFRRGRLIVLVVPVLAATIPSAAWAAPGDPVPVRANPRVIEGVPTSHGAWIGWEQRARRDPSHENYFVRRGSQTPVRVNARGTQAASGGMVGHHVYYVQRFRDRDPRMIDLDLHTGDRVPLPPQVNHHRHIEHPPCCGGQDASVSHMLDTVRGNVSVSGRWLFYSGYMYDVDRDFAYQTAVLYNRVNHRLRRIATYADDAASVWAGQVNGRYATWWWFGRYGGENFYRYDLRTGQTVELPLPDDHRSWDPAVSADGTVYYIHRSVPAEGGPSTFDLVRQTVGAPAEVVRTFNSLVQGLFVRDRPDGSRVVFFQWQDDVYKLVDAAAS